VDGQQVQAEAVISRDTEYAADVLTSLRNGFPWRASVGVEVLETEEVPEGDTREVNGQTVTGPATIVRRGVLREISIVDVAADTRTAVVSAEAAVRQVRMVQALLGQWPELAQRAIRENWSTRRCQLEALRAARPRSVRAMDTHHTSTTDSLDVLRAALRLRAGDKRVTSDYDSRTLELAHRATRMSLIDMARQCLEVEGRGVDRSASAHDVVRAAFSTRSFPHLLKDTAYKVLISYYESYPPTALTVSRIIEVANLQPHTVAQLTARTQFVEVSRGGQLPLGELGDQGWQIQAKTFGRLIAISRADVINDDLNAFVELPRAIADGATRAIDSALWELVSNTTTFFTAANSNILTTTPLSVEGLAKAVEKMRLQKDPMGQPALLRPRFLVVPPGLEALAKQLYTSTTLIARGVDNTIIPDNNPHVGLYEPIVTPYLPSNGANSTWYLVSDPALSPAFGIAFLRGQQVPTIEEVQPDPSYLGVMWRAYIDFGVALLDHRAAVRATA
jgi:hypothetical protein